MNKKTWPSDYQDWTGTFEELVAVANDVLSAEDVKCKPISERAARHYQHTGVLGRGTKQGRVAMFDVQDLTQLLMLKEVLNDGLNLRHASLIYNSPPPSPTLYTRSPGSSKATDVVAKLLAENNLDPSKGLTGLSASLGKMSLQNSTNHAIPKTNLPLTAAAYAANGTLPSSPHVIASATQRYGTQPWCVTYVDLQQAQAAPDHERQAAATILEHLAHHLRSGRTS